LFQQDVIQKDVIQKDVIQKDVIQKDVIQKDVIQKDVIQQGVIQQGDAASEEANTGNPSSAPGDSTLFDATGKVLDSAPMGSEVGELAQVNLRPIQERPRAYNAGGIAYLPSLSRCRLVIVGGGHVGQAVAALATQLDFDVWVVDDRGDCVSQERFPTAKRRIHGVISEILPDLEISAQTYCLVVTRGHNHDQEALFHLVNRGARYLGMIGSKRKIKLIFENLLDHGIEQSELDKVFAPLGIDIGSQTVPEIAVSICAELIAHRNLGRVPRASVGHETA
jgi:xanthine dehydrogenase accessory factor